MNDDKILLDAAYIKLRNNEPMSLTDFDRFIGLIANADFAVQLGSQEEAAAMVSKFVQVLQGKFMRTQQQPQQQ